MIRSGGWVTPGGRTVTMEYRDDTSDWNTISAILTHDEYTMPRGLSGTILDIGAHVGAFAVGAAMDNPAAVVVAVEALPENADLAQRNSDLNHAGVIVLQRAAGVNGRVRYGASDTEFNAGHRFIGGGVWQEDSSATVIDVPTVRLWELVMDYGPVTFLKIDCEGCEWSFLEDAALGEVAEIAGEYHPRGGMGPARLRELLEPTHVVTLDDTLDFGNFRAVRR